MDFLDRNARAADKWQPRPLFSELAELDLPPPSTIIVTCADPRICPEEFLGLQPGDAIVFRTIGGRVKPILQEMVTLDSFIGHGKIHSLIIVHHTDCGASHFTSAGIKEEILHRHPKHAEIVNRWNIGSFEGRSVEDSVREDLDLVRSHELISDEMKHGVKGFVLDIKTGRLNPV